MLLSCCHNNRLLTVKKAATMFNRLFSRCLDDTLTVSVMSAWQSTVLEEYDLSYLNKCKKGHLCST